MPGEEGSLRALPRRVPSPPPDRASAPRRRRGPVRRPRATASRRARRRPRTPRFGRTNRGVSCRTSRGAAPPHELELHVLVGNRDVAAPRRRCRIRRLASELGAYPRPERVELRLLRFDTLAEDASFFLPLREAKADRLRLAPPRQQTADREARQI